MAGYEDTKQKIISTLMGRPVGTEIQPENHQDYALNMLDYIRSLELIATSTLIGVAESNTTPVQPNSSRVCYIAGVAQNQTVVFENFIGENGTPISVTTGDMEGVFIILLWNTQYWSAQTFNTNIISSSESATFYYRYNIRKTYASIALMNADVTSPIGTDGKYIKVGDIVTVVNSTTPSENGIYSYEGAIDGWKYQSSFNFQVEQSRSQNLNSAPSSKLFDDELNKNECYNVTNRMPLPVGQYYDLTSAIAAVPVANRKLGLKLTYMSALYEKDTLTVTTAPTTSGNIVITLNSVAITIALDSTTDTTPTLVATKIKAETFTGWTVSGTGATVIFTKNVVGACSAPIFDAGTTGSVAGFVRTVVGAAESIIETQFNGSSIASWTTATNWRKLATATDLAQIKTDLNKNILYFKALVNNDISIFNKNERYLLNTGTLSTGGNYYTTDYYKLKDLRDLEFNYDYSSSTTNRVTLFDENNNYVGTSVDSNINAIINSNPTAVYARFSILNSNFETFNINISNINLKNEFINFKNEFIYFKNSIFETKVLTSNDFKYENSSNSVLNPIGVEGLFYRIIGTNLRQIIFPLQHNTHYVVEKGISNRFQIMGSVTKPSLDGDILDTLYLPNSPEKTTFEFISNESDNWLLIYVSNESEEPFLTLSGGFLLKKECIPNIPNTLEVLPKPMLAKCFIVVGVIGDSYTAGYMAYPNVEPYNTYPEYSWVSHMKQLTGKTWINFGKGGSSAKSWVEKTLGNLDLVQANGNKCQAYVIGLGINDINNASECPLGTIEDIATDNNSFYAYYYKLVKALIEVNADAKIFCNTLPKEGNVYNYWNNAIIDIVEHCHNTEMLNVYLCDLASEKYMNERYYLHPIFYNDLENGHYTPLGYEFMAECYIQVLSDVMYDNLDEMKTLFKIPYDQQI